MEISLRAAPEVQHLVPLRHLVRPVGSDPDLPDVCAVAGALRYEQSDTADRRLVSELWIG